jgi:hypothetical protein
LPPPSPLLPLSPSVTRTGIFDDRDLRPSFGWLKSTSSIGGFPVAPGEEHARAAARDEETASPTLDRGLRSPRACSTRSADEFVRTR